MSQPGPRVVGLIQARLGSSRLPGKVLADIGGQPLLDMLLRRARRARGVHTWAVATTDVPGDDRLAEHAQALHCVVFRGSQDDVLRRFAGAAAATNADVVVRVTGDCPLLEAAEVDRVVSSFLGRRGTPDELDYLSNGAGGLRRIPHGLDVEVFSAGALLAADAEATEPGHREHVTPYLYRSPGRFRAACLPPAGPDRSQLRLTVDTPADLALVRAIVADLGHDADVDAVASLLARRPELGALNAGVQQKGTRSDAEHRRGRVAGRLLCGRADAGPGVGSGHVARISALLEAWVELGGRATLLGRGLSSSWRERLASAGVGVAGEGLPEPVVAPGQAPDQQPLAGAAAAAATARLATSLGAAALAVDGYAFGQPYQSALRDALPLLAVDDLARFAPVADVVINQNEGFAAERYGPLPAHTRLLVGGAYVLLRREFRDPAGGPAGSPATVSVDSSVAALASARGPERALVTFGGADPAALTPWVASAVLAALGPEDELVVLAGASMAPSVQASLAELVAAAGGGGPRLQLLAEVRNMATLLQSVTVAVSAAGSTTWELMRCGVPALLVSVADNQRAVASGAAAAGAAVDLGWHAALTPEGVEAELSALLGTPGRAAAQARRGQQLIDGRGVFRAIDALLDAIERREANA